MSDENNKTNVVVQVLRILILVIAFFVFYYLYGLLKSEETTHSIYAKIWMFGLGFSSIVWIVLFFTSTGLSKKLLYLFLFFITTTGLIGEFQNISAFELLQNTASVFF